MDKLTCYVWLKILALIKLVLLDKFIKKKIFFLSLNKIDLPRQICLNVIKLKVINWLYAFKKFFILIKIILLDKFIIKKIIKL